MMRIKNKIEQIFKKYNVTVISSTKILTIYKIKVDENKINKLKKDINNIPNLFFYKNNNNEIFIMVEHLISIGNLV